jgi:hypothetical protein
MTKTLFFCLESWTIGIYLLFGACNLVLLPRNQTFVAILRTELVWDLVLGDWQFTEVPYPPGSFSTLL